ncbi:MAG: glycine cleavage system aminomethyltransferase GcvT [Candidatus Omnitrophota bacterium]
MSDTEQTLRKTFLYEKHLEAGARMVPFAGWDMPVQYTGIIEEHIHTREKAGLFDICHMGEFILSGDSAAEDVDRIVTCRVDDMPEGKCRYGFLLNEEGGIIDDLIVFRLSLSEFMLVVNSGTTEKDSLWIQRNISRNTGFTDISDKTAKLDLQGPLSGLILGELTGKDVLKGLGRFCFTRAEISGVEILLSRTGYTGETGYELFFSPEHSFRMWETLLESGGVKPVGLGARDTLRLEMGYSLYGNDIDESHTPVEADLMRFVFMDKDFIGRDKLAGAKKQGTKRVLTGFVCEGRKSARSHYKIMSGTYEKGEVTSGAFSPCLKKGIGLCYLDRDRASAGGEIYIDDGRSGIKAEVAAPPFYKREA